MSVVLLGTASELPQFPWETLTIDFISQGPILSGAKQLDKTFSHGSIKKSERLTQVWHTMSAG